MLTGSRCSDSATHGSQKIHVSAGVRFRTRRYYAVFLEEPVRISRISIYLGSLRGRVHPRCFVHSEHLVYERGIGTENVS